MMPQRAAVAIGDLLDNCAQIQPGMNVLIVAAVDGLYGGANLVDEQAISWIQTMVQQRGANASVLWLDMPTRPASVWSNGRVEGWRVPKVFKGALSGSDIWINHCVDLSFEEELKEVADLCREYNSAMVRNMATTSALLCSTWAQTPYELVSEIRFQTASILQPGLRWTLTHPNGTHLEGTIGKVASANQYASRRTEGLYRPFPEGVFPALTTGDAEGELVFEGTNPIWARHLGIPHHFDQPVRLGVREGHIREFRGGAEADQLRQTYAELAEELGDDAYHIRGTHGGVHPYARVNELQCPDPAYRGFIEHHHWSSQHVHMGNSNRKADFPYHMHVTAEVRGATLKIGDNYLWKDGRLTALDHPAVAAVAKKYPDRPGLDADRWSE
jgi:hypothetical protein